MCGIAGALSWSPHPEPRDVAAMVARLVHRGPDASGLEARGPAVLGHRRLTVIDVSEASDQPLADVTGRYWIVYNGEIYNYRELREELRQGGATFRTVGDTEVILEAYKRWGDAALERLNGMFALALWDEVRERLLLARDRAGEKPLYYQPLDRGGLIFASELQALRAHPAASRAVDPAAVSQFLSLNYLLTDTCILAGVRKLPAAHRLAVERGGAAAPERYWDLAPAFRDKRAFASEEEAAAALDELVDDAVRLRLVSDVPLGAFLSGGVDSSTVVESMTRLRPPAQNRTFSVGFEEESFSELPEARRVAAFLAVDHRDRRVDADAASHLPEIAARFDEPFADSSMIPVYYLARFARERVTVSLSGDGGDEIFAGYPTYRADLYHRRLRFLPGWIWPPAYRALDALWPVSFDKVSFDYKLRQFVTGLPLDYRRAHHHWRTIFSPAEKRELLRPAYRELSAEDGFGVFDRYFDEVADCHLLDQAMYVDIKTWMVDDILVKVDRATMAHSLESRAPFLDHRLMELAAGLPVSLKLRGRRSKYLLRRARAPRLPAEVFERPKKGFNAPVSHWLRTSLAGLARRAIDDGPLADWVRPEAVARLRSEHEAGRRDHGLKLFGLVCLGLWMARGA